MKRAIDEPGHWTIIKPPEAAHPLPVRHWINIPIQHASSFRVLDADSIGAYPSGAHAVKPNSMKDFMVGGDAMKNCLKSARVIIVGGGVGGLSVAMGVARMGCHVTLLEGARLGFSASTRNQGWLHSGGAYALTAPRLAALCRNCLYRTISFCPECVEHEAGDALFILSRPESDADAWQSAWRSLDITAREVSRVEAVDHMPVLASSPVQRVFYLPDRAIRPSRLLKKIAQTARDHGADIRTGVHVQEVLVASDDRVEGVRLSGGDKLPADIVVLACGVGENLVPSDFDPWHVQGSEIEVVRLMNQLVAVNPPLGPSPVCVLDEERLTHVPHPPWSILGIEHWSPTNRTQDEEPVVSLFASLWGAFLRFFPNVDLCHHRQYCWEGRFAQAMLHDQVVPGAEPLPVVVDHGDQGGPKNLISVFPGRLTLWPVMADCALQLVSRQLAG